MNKISFDINAMKFISMFQSLTHATVKDCIDRDGQIMFIVKEGDIGKAIGKKGVNIKNLENKLKKKVKVIEYNDQVETFVQNLFYPNKAKEITVEEGIVKVVPEDIRGRGYMIGRGAENLRKVEDIVKRYFDIKEIKVV